MFWKVQIVNFHVLYFCETTPTFWDNHQLSETITNRHHNGGVNVDFRFCYATYLITTFFWENIFSKCLIFLEDHVQAFRTHVVRASNSSWARRYPLSKMDEFREIPDLEPYVTAFSWHIWDLLSELSTKLWFFSREGQADLGFGIWSELVLIGGLCAEIVDFDVFLMILDFQLWFWVSGW